MPIQIVLISSESNTSSERDNTMGEIMEQAPKTSVSLRHIHKAVSKQIQLVSDQIRDRESVKFRVV
ncbi:MAG: hypothetical protein NPIRA01_08000 [Nitrospirales bacterium]|nr:MAG: hypothetical protein NPIRA01_08000 [Nitrospirales bacterium]